MHTILLRHDKFLTQTVTSFSEKTHTAAAVAVATRTKNKCKITPTEMLRPIRHSFATHSPATVRSETKTKQNAVRGGQAGGRTFDVALVAGALRADALSAHGAALTPHHQGERGGAHATEGLVWRRNGTERGAPGRGGGRVVAAASKSRVRVVLSSEAQKHGCSKSTGRGRGGGAEAFFIAPTTAAQIGGATSDVPPHTVQAQMYHAFNKKKKNSRKKETPHRTGPVSPAP